MADNNNIPTVNPLADLKQDAIDNLNNIKSQLDETEKDIAAMDAIGLDTSKLKDRLEWARNARKIILNRYGIKE